MDYDVIVGGKVENFLILLNNMLGLNKFYIILYMSYLYYRRVVIKPDETFRKLNRM
jgi:hypothetical protein